MKRRSQRSRPLFWNRRGEGRSEEIVHIEHHTWWSNRLGQNMSVNVYGHAGKPVLVFPCQGGTHREYEDFGMVEAISGFIGAGRIKLFTVDSVDDQSWNNRRLHPAQRVARHKEYESYINEEVLPLIYYHHQAEEKLMVTGCSMGGYHAANYFFRRPDLSDIMISISGLFQLDYFIGDYMDDQIYFHTPLAYLPGLNDPWYIDQYRRSRIIVGVGQGEWEEPMAVDAVKLQKILDEKGVPAWVDLWGHDVNHDWPWWRRMMPYFLGTLF